MESNNEAGATYDLMAHRMKLVERYIEQFKKDKDITNEKLTLVEKEQITIKNDQKNVQDSLNEIKEQLKTIQQNQQKDQGWRVVLIDFVKAVAQIAALIGAGKFLF